MAQTAANARVWGSGGIFRAPAGTSVPTDAITPLDVAFKEVGYLGDDGITTNWYETTTNDVVAWQNGEKVRRIQTEITSTVTFSMLETNDETRKVQHGDDNVGGGITYITTEEGVRGVWVIQAYDSAGFVERTVIYDAQVTTRGESQKINTDVARSPITLTCYAADLPGGRRGPAVIYEAATSITS